MAACWVVIPRDIQICQLVGLYYQGMYMAVCWVVLPRDVHVSLLGCTTSGCTWQLVGLYYLGMYMAACWVVKPRDVHGSLLGCTTSGCIWQLVGLYYHGIYIHSSLFGCNTSGCTWQLVGLYYLGMYMAACWVVLSRDVHDSCISNSLSMFINILEFLFKNLVFAKLSSDTLHQRHKQDLKKKL